MLFHLNLIAQQVDYVKVVCRILFSTFGQNWATLQHGLSLWSVWSSYIKS